MSTTGPVACRDRTLDVRAANALPPVEVVDMLAGLAGASVQDAEEDLAHVACPAVMALEVPVRRRVALDWCSRHDPAATDSVIALLGRLDHLPDHHEHGGGGDHHEHGGGGEHHDHLDNGLHKGHAGLAVHATLRELLHQLASLRARAAASRRATA